MPCVLTGGEAVTAQGCGSHGSDIVESSPGMDTRGTSRNWRDSVIFLCPNLAAPILRVNSLLIFL